eukprot:CAMPEP_0203917536 /NCGR_PEP_ID=MMETSP0359-20131031/58149_1 /ASSEMBLY_ACC=CAM_ASM_000338 /TAXON_ID=268821 /ORGANISM="Scrippsiella Hangoei, Strain SHTV-5" /LENGTH=101 /DNA_ID=CAMNT_0050844465 /DNA_START=346 /DNA_END=651 /DNA_ORIENTATION=+
MNLNSQVLELGLGGPSEGPLLQQLFLKLVELRSEDTVDTLACSSEHSVQVKGASRWRCTGRTRGRGISESPLRQRQPCIDDQTVRANVAGRWRCTVQAKPP